MYRGVILFGAGAIILSSSPAWAGSQQESEQPTSNDTASVDSLQDIIVTAQKRSERLHDVPSTITALAREDLARAGVSSVRDLATLVSGFTFSGAGPLAQPSIRGVSSNIIGGSAENSNAVYYDGIYSANPAALNNYLPDVERIEVLKGPQGTLFGRNATGGAIRIFTRSPSFVTTGSANLEVGYYTGDGGSDSSSQVRLNGYLSGPIVSDLIAVSLASGITRTDGWLHDDRSGQTVGRSKADSIRGKILITPTSDLNITLTGFYNRLEHTPNRIGFPVNGLTQAANYPGSIIPTIPWHVALTPTFDETRNIQHGGSIRIELNTSVGTITSLSGYLKTKAPGNNALSSADPAPACVAQFRCLNFTTVKQNLTEKSQELTFTSKAFGSLRFTAGAYYYGSSAPTLAFIQFNVRALDNDFKKDAFAVYGEGELSLTDDFTLIAGVRQSHEKQRDRNFLTAPGILFKNNENSTTPRVALKYDVNSNLNLYASYSVGVRTGSTGARNGDGTIVKPEELTAYEAGVKYSSPTLVLNGSAFIYDYKDLQVQASNGAIFIVQNSGNAKIYGVDLDGTVILGDGLRLQGAMSWLPKSEYRAYTNAQVVNASLRNVVIDASGLRTIRSARLTGSMTLSYEKQLAPGDLDASITGSYSSSFKHDILGLIRQAPYAVLNAQLGFKPTTFPIRLGIYGRNLTNKLYTNAGYANTSSVQAYFGAPRELGLSVSSQF